MEQIIQATVLGARRFDIDGNKIGSMFISQPVDKKQADYVGHEIMKVSCPYELIDQVRFLKVPGDYRLTCKMKTASGGKVGLEVLRLEEIEIGKAK